MTTSVVGYALITLGPAPFLTVMAVDPAGDVSGPISVITSSALGACLVVFGWCSITGRIFFKPERDGYIKREAEKDRQLEDYRRLVGSVISQSGRTLPVIAETAHRVTEARDDRMDTVLGMMEELKEAITHGG